MPERCVKTLPIEAQNAVIARAMASICNEEWWCFGVQGGHGGLPLKLSVMRRDFIAHAARR